MSSTALQDMPLLSSTTTWVSGTLPQLLTTPLNEMLVVPNPPVARHVFVASMHLVLFPTRRSSDLALLTWPPQRPSAEAIIVSVRGPQKVADTVCVPE